MKKSLILVLAISISSAVLIAEEFPKWGLVYRQRSDLKLRALLAVGLVAGETVTTWALGLSAASLWSLAPGGAALYLGAWRGSSRPDQLVLKRGDCI